jgi:hypothetical protein
MLTESDHLIISKCLKAAADGPFFPDWEFATLFGFSRDEFRRQASMYEPADDQPIHVGYAVHNALNHLVGYPIDSEDQWSIWIPVSRAEVNELLIKWSNHFGYA